MPGDRRQLTRADLPDDLTPETIRRLPLATLRRLGRPGNGILLEEEQAGFDVALHEVMSQAAGRVSQQLGRSDWAALRRDAAAQSGRRGGPGRPSRVDEQLRRIAERIDRQVDVAESLAPAVDWSFAQGGDQGDHRADASEADRPSVDAAPPDTETDTDTDTDTVSDLEDRLSEQVELVQVMSEIAEVSKRTYALEEQRDLQNTRTVFFGFVVSVAVLVAGYAPLVAAEDWAERAWVLGLSFATCVIGGLVYALIRKRQIRDQAEKDEHPA